MKLVIYCRVNTEGQEQDGTSLQTQLEACFNHIVIPMLDKHRDVCCFMRTLRYEVILFQQ